MSKHKTRQISRITQATLNLIADEGLSHLNISRIAETAGMTRQTVYKYFPDVENIIAHALEAHGKAMEQHVFEIFSAPASPREKLVAFARFQISIASSGHESISLEAGLSPVVRERLDQYPRSAVLGLQQVIRQGIESGDFSRTIDPVMAGELVWGVAQGAASAASKHTDQKPYFLEAVEKAMMAIVGGQH